MNLSPSDLKTIFYAWLVVLISGVAGLLFQINFVTPVLAAIATGLTVGRIWSHRKMNAVLVCFGLSILQSWQAASAIVKNYALEICFKSSKTDVYPEIWLVAFPVFSGLVFISVVTTIVSVSVME